MKFKPGDKVRFVGGPRAAELSESGRKHLNHEHTIVGISSLLSLLRSEFCYVIKCTCDGVDYHAPEWSLEPIQRRPATGSWDEIEKVTGWNPVRVRVTA